MPHETDNAAATTSAPGAFNAPAADGEASRKGVSPLVQAPAPEPDAAGLADALEDAAVALAGIADALAARAAAEPDDLLELLADAADARARALRSLG